MTADCQAGRLFTMDEPTPARDFRALSLRWIPDDRPPGGQWSALLRLSAAIRRTIDLMADTDAPEADLLAAAEAAESFAERLGEAPRGRRLWGFAESSNAGNPRAMFDNSPLMGLANPIAPPLRLAIDDDGAVRGTAVFGTAYEGPPGHLHGGFVAAAFDEVLGMVQAMTGQPGMTAGLTVRYRKPTPLHREVQFEGRIDRVEGRKIFTAGTVHAGEMLCAEAEAIFVSVDWPRMQGMAAERGSSR